MLKLTGNVMVFSFSFSINFKIKRFLLNPSTLTIIKLALLTLAHCDPF